MCIGVWQVEWCDQKLEIFLLDFIFPSFWVLLLSTLKQVVRGSIPDSLEGRIHLLSNKLVTVKLRWIFHRYNIIMRIYNRPLAKVSLCWIESFLACHCLLPFQYIVIRVKEIVGTRKDSLVTVKYLSIGKSEGLIFMACYLSLDDWKSYSFGICLK
jgi:hypothetical protein